MCFAKPVPLSNEGGGMEVLVGGTGLAWIGSGGSISSNPALLSWHPKKKRFISTNQLRYFKQGKQASDVTVGDDTSPANLDVKVEVLPVYAATTDHNDEFGYGYGLSVDQLNATVSGVSGNTTTLTDYREQAITVITGAGKNYGNHGFGVSLYGGRLSIDQKTLFYGQDSGVDFIGHNNSTNSEWAAGAGLGWAYVGDRWSVGASSKFNLIKFGGTGRNSLTFLQGTGGTVIKTIDHDRENFNLLPAHGFGFRRVLGNHVVFGDLRYTASYTDTDGDKANASSTLSLALISRIGEHWKSYLGSVYTPEVSHSKAEDDDATLGLTSGLSKAGKHSVNYGGLTYSQGLASRPDHLFLLTFGTQFDY
jgi:hypothetical protein